MSEEKEQTLFEFLLEAYNKSLEEGKQKVVRLTITAEDEES